MNLMPSTYDLRGHLEKRRSIAEVTEVLAKRRPIIEALDPSPPSWKESDSPRENSLSHCASGDDKETNETEKAEAARAMGLIHSLPELADGHIEISCVDGIWCIRLEDQRRCVIAEGRGDTFSEALLAPASGLIRGDFPAKQAVK